MLEVSLNIDTATLLRNKFPKMCVSVCLQVTVNRPRLRSATVFGDVMGG